MLKVEDKLKVGLDAPNNFNYIKKFIYRNYFFQDFCGIFFFLTDKTRKNPDKNIARFRHDRTANKSWF